MYLQLSNSTPRTLSYLLKARTHPEPDEESRGLDASSDPVMSPQLVLGSPSVDIDTNLAQPSTILKSGPALKSSSVNEEHGPVWSDIGSAPLMDAHTTHVASMDSGYATASVPACQRSSVGTQDDNPKLPASTAIDECDARTVYSDQGSIVGGELDTYKVELVNNL